MRPEIHITVVSTIRFTSDVLTLLNKRGFLVNSIEEALDCIDALTYEKLVNDTYKAMEEIRNVKAD